MATIPLVPLLLLSHWLVAVAVAVALMGVPPGVVDTRTLVEAVGVLTTCRSAADVSPALAVVIRSWSPSLSAALLVKLVLPAVPASVTGVSVFT